MKNEMTLDKTGLTIPGSELAECGMAGVDLSAQMGEQIRWYLSASASSTLPKLV